MEEENQIVKLVETENGPMALFQLDGEVLNTPIYGSWDKPVFFGKEIAQFLGFQRPHEALQKHVKSKHKTTLKEVYAESAYTSFREPLTYNEGKQIMIFEPGLYSLAMHSRLPRAEIFQDKVFEVILPSLRKYGQVTLQKELSESVAKLAIQEKEGIKTRSMLEHERKAREEAERQQKIAELRSLTLQRLNVAFQERAKTQIFYIVTSIAMSKDNEFKIGGVENHSLLKKRLSMYNTGNSGVHPELTMFFIFLVEVSNYKQMEMRMKELIQPFRSKRQANTENFNLHLNILKPLTEMVAENYNEEIEKLNEFVKALLETHTQEYVDPVEVTPIDPDSIPDHLDVQLTITRRGFGTTNTQKTKISDLNDSELKVVVARVVENLGNVEGQASTIRRKDVEKILSNTFVIESNLRRIWDVTKPLIEESGKTPKY